MTISIPVSYTHLIIRIADIPKERMVSDAVNNSKICAGKRMTANVPSIIIPVTKAVPYRKAECSLSLLPAP